MQNEARRNIRPTTKYTKNTVTNSQQMLWVICESFCELKCLEQIFFTFLLHCGHTLPYVVSLFLLQNVGIISAQNSSLFGTECGSHFTSELITIWYRMRISFRLRTHHNLTQKGVSYLGFRTHHYLTQNNGLISASELITIWKCGSHFGTELI